VFVPLVLTLPTPSMLTYDVWLKVKKLFGVVSAESA
jgi:hypothetical protein